MRPTTTSLRATQPGPTRRFTCSSSASQAFTTSQRSLRRFSANTGPSAAEMAPSTRTVASSNGSSRSKQMAPSKRSTTSSGTVSR